MPTVVRIRDNPAMAEAAIGYFQARWASDASRPVYRDCITHSLTTAAPLPRWYLLTEGDQILGCAGLITNDFISRMDLWPWLCALYVEPASRGHAYGATLIEAARTDACAAGFDALYLCTDHIGYYERYGFTYLGDGYHPWGETSRIYRCGLL